MLNADQVSEEALARFEREVQLTSKLNHPNTIAIYDFGRTADGIFYYAMEYLEGIDLDRLAVQYGPQPVGRTLAILKQVSASLVEAHAGGLIHRDIKPANLLLTNRAGIPDFVKVLDFGLVKAMEVGGGTRLTATNIAVGTPDFMAPEAIEQPEAVTAAADIYAIGAVGYFLLTATPVFKGKTAMDVCMKHLKTTPEPVSDRLGRAIDPAVEAVILRCLAKKPEDRFPSTAALLEALSACPAQDWTAAEATAWWARFHGQRGAKSGA
jgi:serine/threonine protein kinase